MLDFLRRSASSVFAWLILGALALVFGLQFGLPSDSLSFGAGAYAKAYGTAIGDDEYRYQFNVLRRVVNVPKDARLQQLMGVKEEVLEAAIEREVLVEGGHALGLEATAHDAEDLVLAGHFIVLGETADWLSPELAFNYEIFAKSLLPQLQVSEPKYLEIQRRELLARTVRDLLAGSAVVGEGELRSIYDEGANRLNLRYARYEPLQFGELIDLDDAEVTKYLEAHRAELSQQYASQGSRFAKLPKQSRVWLIALDKPASASPAADGADGADGATDATDDAGEGPPKNPPAADAGAAAKPRKGKPGDDPAATVRAQLSALRGRIDRGEDFRKLAREFSRHESALRGGELGWISESVGSGIDPAIDAAVQAAKPGTLSEVIEGADAFYLVQVRARREGDIPEADALPELAEEGLRREKGRALAKTAAQEDLAAIVAGAALTDVFRGGSALGGDGGGIEDARDARKRVELSETGSFAKGDAPPGLGTAPELITAAWAGTPDQGLLDQVFEVGQDYALAGVIEKSEATDAGFADARRELYRQLVARKGQQVTARWTHRRCIEGKAKGQISGDADKLTKLVSYEVANEDGTTAPQQPYELCDRVGNRGGMLRGGGRGGFPGDG